MIHLKDNGLMCTGCRLQVHKYIQILQEVSIGLQSKLIIESYMPDNQIIFLDGIEPDFIKFNSESIATIITAKEKANLVLAD